MKQKYFFIKFVMAMAIFAFLGSSSTFAQATLTHSYTFEDGTFDASTVYDQVGSVDGTIGGDKISIANGMATVSGATVNSDGWISFDGAALALNTYSSISIEIMIEAGNLQNVDVYTMLCYFGTTTAGENCLWMQPTRQPNNESKWQAQTTNDGGGGMWSYSIDNELDDGKKHHIVGILNALSLDYYLDGIRVATFDTEGKDYISSIGTAVANLFRGVDGWNDPNYNGSVAEFNIYDGDMDETTIKERTADFLGLDPTDATLSALNYSKGALTPAFDPATTTYELAVEFGSSKVILDPVTTVEGATVAMTDGLGNPITDGVVSVPAGGVSVEIVVTALNGVSQQTYNLLITLDPEAETASLTDIQLSVGSLLQEFDMDTLHYTASVPYGTTSVDVTGIPAGSGAGVSGGGTVNLTDGVGSATLTVTSEDGNSTKVYTVDIFATKVTIGEFYYIVNEASDNLVLGGSHLGDKVPRLYVPINNDETQLFEFVESGVENQYYIRNKVPSYLASSTTSANHWDMEMLGDQPNDLDSIRFILDEFEKGRFRIYTVARLNADNESYKNMLSPNDVNVGTTVYNDKWIDSEWDVAGYTIWNILFPDEVVDPYDTYLSDLTIDEASLKPAFESYKQEYYVTVPIGVTTLNITATANDVTATVTGDGAIDVSDGEGTITITVTATDPQYTREYVIHYLSDTPLSLTHSYTFEDGTAQDQVGIAHGTVAGGSITEGVYTTAVNGEDFITLPSDVIALNTYPSITMEAYVLTGENLGWSMLAYFGGLSGSKAHWMSIAGETDVSRTALEMGLASDFAEGPEPGTGEPHHYVSVLSNDSLYWYVDGSLVSKIEINPAYYIHAISTENAWLCKSGYNDPTWIGSIYEYNIYSGQMDAETVSQRAYQFPVEDATTDATLSDLTVDGTTVEGFASYTLSYDVSLPKTTTVVPAVAGTTTNPSASAIVTDAEGIPGTTFISVTAEDGITVNTYKVNFAYEVSAEATLSDLTVYGASIVGFTPEVTYYEFILDDTATAVPAVEGIPASESATVVVNDASALPGNTTVVVTAEDGVTSSTYTVAFKYDVSSDPSLSDIKVDGTSIDGFDSDKITYIVNLPAGTTVVPSVTYTTTDGGASVNVTDASSLPGTTVLVVTAEDGITKRTYTVSFNVLTTGISNTELSKVRVYPTIFNDRFNIEISEGIANILVYDITGKPIIEEKDRTGVVEIQVSKSGVYFVQVESEGAVNTYKVFKVK